MNKLIIGLAGRKQSGKTTAAMKLQKSGFYRLGFAFPIKSMVWHLLNDMGFTYDQIQLFLDHGKEHEIPGIGQSARHLMQTLGTEWGRMQVNPDLWIISARRYLERTDNKLIVIDDVRFDNEAHMIRDMGGFIIHIDRYVVPDGHVSEDGINELDDDYFIDNDGTLEDFLTDVSIVVAGLLEL